MSRHLAIESEQLLTMRPTQMTVGFAEVELKRREWRGISHRERSSYLRDHAFPGVRGPERRFFLVDHHHLGRALIEEGVKDAPVSILKNLSMLAKDEFWVVMDHQHWVHPYDADGKRHPFADIPKRLSKLVDDPYRSLAAEVRRKGGFAKETSFFSEFLWADFFRRRVSKKSLVANFEAAVHQALVLSHSPAASHLPGWSGIAG